MEKSIIINFIFISEEDNELVEEIKNNISLNFKVDESDIDIPFKNDSSRELELNELINLIKDCK